MLAFLLGKQAALNSPGEGSTRRMLAVALPSDTLFEIFAEIFKSGSDPRG